MKKIISKKIPTILVFILVAAFSLSACKPAGTPTPSAAEIAQQVAFTQQAKATQNSVETLVALVTALSQPTATPAPTNTPLPTATQAATTAVPTAQTEPVTSAPTQDDSGTKCYQFEFLGDVSYPPGSIVDPGKKFTKTWKVKNTGTCEWTREFDLVMTGGEAFGTNKYSDFTRIVAPGEIADLTVPDMIAPLTPGTYYSYWVISTNNGVRFGYGPDQQMGMGIQIIVPEK